MYNIYEDICLYLCFNRFKMYHMHIFTGTEEDAYIDSEDEDIQSDERFVEIL